MSAGAPLGVMGWANGCHTMTPCVCWCVVLASLASGQGVSCGWVSIRSGRSPSDMMLAFYQTFLFLSFFLGLPEKDYVLIIKKLNVQCCTTCPKH